LIDDEATNVFQKITTRGVIQATSNKHCLYILENEEASWHYFYNAMPFHAHQAQSSET
jgi:hypothetical protein